MTGIQEILFVLYTNPGNRISVKFIQAVPEAKFCTVLLGVYMDVAFRRLLLFRLLFCKPVCQRKTPQSA